MSTKIPAVLANYQFNIRSFHPNETFGWSGLYFEGDNRGFSLKPSDSRSITSRIWQRFTLNAQSGTVHDVKTRADPSRAPWQEEALQYNDKKQRPKWSITPHKRDLSSNVKHYRIYGRYSGENHAMPGSSVMNEHLGLSYVPSLNVNYKILVDIDRLNRHIDVVAYIKGDGFPNCEAFIVGPGDTRVFLGVHVRKGLAPITLAANLDYPMIAAAIRLPINRDGSFSGTIGDELARRNAGKSDLEYHNISDWNARFKSISPNSGRCKGLEDPNYLKELRNLDCLI